MVAESPGNNISAIHSPITIHEVLRAGAKIETHVRRNDCTKRWMSGVSVKTKHVVYDFDPWIVLTRDLPSWIFSLKSSNDKTESSTWTLEESPGSGPDWLSGVIFW